MAGEGAGALGGPAPEAVYIVEHRGGHIRDLPAYGSRRGGRKDRRQTDGTCIRCLQWLHGFTYFRRNDVLIAKITPCFENGKGACLLSLPTEIGFGSTEFHVLRAKSSILPQFLYRVTTVAEFRRLGADAMTGAAGQQRVSQSFIADYPIALPPLAEQAGIVRFLDHVDRRIRRYIRAKQKLIKLLEEQKQAIIHRAVTRGLDPNVRLKPSGVEWLGDVPEHWSVRRAKHLFREVDRRSVAGTEVLLSLRMYQGLVPHNEVSTTPISAQALVGFKKVEPGQIVMNRMRAAIGMFGLARQRDWLVPTTRFLSRSHIPTRRTSCTSSKPESPAPPSALSPGGLAPGPLASCGYTQIDS